ncbi:hypothetical protein C8J57DRAFT_326170 [Mycena rebaudengoi]|nr:hypothetical protein C8J57DRAFT_326170 [Mycena rebaudengoi]
MTGPTNARCAPCAFLPCFPLLDSCLGGRIRVSTGRGTSNRWIARESSRHSPDDQSRLSSKSLLALSLRPQLYCGRVPWTSLLPAWCYHLFGVLLEAHAGSAVLPRRRRFSPSPSFRVCPYPPAAHAQPRLRPVSHTHATRCLNYIPTRVNHKTAPSSTYRSAVPESG